MMKLAICDDEKQQLENIKGYVRKYLMQKPETDISVFCFSSSEELLKEVEESGGFDIYILDIIMPGHNGIYLGKQLRLLHKDALIIYLTTSPDFAVDSYMVRAFHYLLKPIEPDKLYTVLDEAFHYLQLGLSPNLLVKTSDGICHLSLQSISYVELYRRCICYHLQNGQCVTGVTLRIPFMKAMEQLLEDERFIACGASFVINLHYVVKLESNSAIMENGYRISIPRNSFQTVKQQWMDYWLKKGDIYDIHR